MDFAQNRLEVGHLARLVHPGKKGHRFMAVLQFKFDESYDNRFMSIGGWLGEEQEWTRLETSWQHLVDRLNFQNRSDQRISGFHAADMNNYGEEFVNWTPEMSGRFAQKLIGFLGKRKVAAITVGLDNDALTEVFPDNGDARERRAYTLCIKFALNRVAKIMREYYPEDMVHVVFEKGNWDREALEAYNFVVDYARWDDRRFFSGITALTKKGCVGLQAADMIAYEAHRALKSRVAHCSYVLRKPILAMLEKKIYIHGGYLDKETVLALQAELEDRRGVLVTSVK